MVCLYRSPFPVGGGGILLVQIIHLPSRGLIKRGGGRSAPCGINPRNNENCVQLYTESRVKIWIYNCSKDVYIHTLPLLIHEAL
jgi:hypothetical protein